MLDVKTGKRPWELIEIKVKNDLGRECWYKSNKFDLFAEGAAYLKKPMAAGAGQSAGQSATPDGLQMIKEIDAAAGFTARQALELGEQAMKGLMDGMGLHYGA